MSRWNRWFVVAAPPADQKINKHTVNPSLNTRFSVTPSTDGRFVGAVFCRRSGALHPDVTRCRVEG
jgi:hypothetical protein